MPPVMPLLFVRSVLGVFVFCVVLFCRPGKVASQETIPVVSAAMESMFSPLTSPKRKTMGLLQRNFLEVAGRSSELEVALVVDGTDSMADEMKGIQGSILRMLDDLQRLRNHPIRVNLVVYRDAGDPDYDLETLLPTFTSDRNEIQSAVELLSPRSGAPYYYELADLGIHHAITQLEWNENPTVSKWIMLFADAPPYPIDFADEALPKASRRFADEKLVAAASARGIQIHCVLCKSTDQTLESHQESIDRTRRFMDRMSSETGGMVLDLSYPVIRKALAGRRKSEPLQFTPIEPITTRDFASDSTMSSRDDKQFRIAILPHEAIEQIQFDPERPAAQVATALVSKFRQLPGLRVKNPLDVERQLRRMRAEGLSDMEAIRGLAGRLRVDYLVWGRLRENDSVTRTVAFRQRDGSPVLTVSHRGSPDGLATVVLEAAAKSADRDPDLADFAQRVLAQANSSLLREPLAKDTPTVTAILTAIGSLEQALGQEVGSDESEGWLARAEAAAKLAISQESSNPLAHWVLSNTSFNQASALFREGDQERAGEAMRQCRSSLRLAYNRRQDIHSEPLSVEIQADYQLIVKRDSEEAIKRYRELLGSEMPKDSQRRGHWMLAGLYSGDWGVSAESTDPKKAREHVVAMLKDWPDSPESAQLKKWLHWDQTAKKSRHHFLPKLHTVLTGLGEESPE